MSSSFKHNKKRNSGLVYEFLVRRLGLTMVDRDPESYLKTVGIVKKYFSPGMPLEREKEVFNVIAKSRGLNESTARRVLGEVQKHITGLDPKKVEIKKSNLIKEVHYTFGQNFFDVHRIPEYRLYASIQMLIEQYRINASGANITEGVQKIQLEEGLVKFMTSPKGAEQQGTKGERVDGLVASLAMRKFEQRYSGALNEAQKLTLRRFMNFSMTKNKDQFSREMEEEKEQLLEGLRSAQKLVCFHEDKVMGQKMDEAVQVLEGLRDMTSEASVQELLLYHRLLQEIESDE